MKDSGLKVKKNTREKIKNALDKYKWWVLGLVFLYPFYCLLIGEIFWCSGRELYTFGLPLRDFMTIWIALGGIIGVVFNILLMQRRVLYQEQQLLEQQKQFDTQIEKQNVQIQIQQKQHRDTRFSMGVELLGNQHESARVGGAYNLYFLAKENPKEYMESTCEILCAHIRTITSDKEYQKKYKDKPSNEIQTILNLIFEEGQEGKPIFGFYTCKNLKGAYLCGIEINLSTLCQVRFDNAILRNVIFGCTGLYEIHFENAVFENVVFENIIYDVIDLNELFFDGATLNNVCFKEGDFALNNSIFRRAKLSNIDFSNVELNNIDFEGAVFQENVNFKGTALEGYNFEEITHKGWSLELTKPEEVESDKN